MTITDPHPTVVADQLATLARHLRRRQSTESDIIVDALTTDPGAAD